VTRRLSLGMQVARLFVRLQRRRTRTPAELDGAYVGRRTPAWPALPRRLRAACHVEEAEVLGRTVYTLTPRRRPSGWHIVYTHGGSFVNPLVYAHWWIIEALVRTTGATVIVPMYPLAPEHAFARAHELLEVVYRGLVAKVAPARVVLAGDSAGGNLALVQAILYRDQGLPLPGRLILFAPWLDLTMSNPEAAEVERRDVMLRIAELRHCGAWWAGETDPRDPRLSPIFAELAGLPPMLVYQGSDDVLAPDGRLLRDRVARAGGHVELRETAGAFHVFMGATFTREARAVFEHIRDVLAAEG
jgi:epsilon-lactone hydrolase